MALVIVGLVAVAVGAALLLWRRRTLATVAQARRQATEPPAAIAALCAAVAGELGPGQFCQRVECAGVAEADTPLVAPVSGQACVALHVQVSREYEAIEETKDAEGKVQRRTVRRSDTVSTDTRRVPFRLADAGAAVQVDPAGADLEGEQRHEQFRPEEAGRADRAGGRTLGYRTVETIVPVGARLYVLGEAADAGGALTIRRPGDRGQRFIISLKSEAELLRGYSRQATALVWLGGAALTAGGALILIGTVT